MKIIGLAVLALFLEIINFISILWIIVELLLYLVKDSKFNWSSIWVFVISAIILFVVRIASKNNYNKRNGK